MEWVTMLLAFSLSNISLLQQTVDFEWKSAIAAKVWTNVAKKGLVNVSLFISLSNTRVHTLFTMVIYVSDILV